MSPATLLGMAMVLASPEPIIVPPPAPAAGIVVDEKGNPVAGVEVFLVGTLSTGESPILWRGRSDADGRFEADRRKGYGEGPPFAFAFQDLLAVAPGWRPAARRLAIRSDPTRDDPERIVLRPAPGVPVRVLGPDGTPVADARLRVPNGPHLLRFPTELSTRLAATTGADGRALLTAFAAEDCRTAFVETPAFGRQEFAFDTHDSGERIFILRPVGRLKGHVVVDPPTLARGLRVSGGTRMVPSRGRSIQVGSFEVTCDEDGRFDVPALGAGELNFSFLTQPAVDRFLRKVESKRIEAGVLTDVEIVYDRGVPVRGVILERGTDRPLSGATVRLAVLQAPAIPCARTDAAGRFNAFLPPGRATVSLIDAGPFVPPGPFRRESTIIPNQVGTFELPAVEVVRGVDVRGVVIDERGRPADGAVIEAIRSDGLGVTALSLIQPVLVANHRGVFLLKNMAPGMPLELSARLGDAATGPPEPIEPEAAKAVTLVVKAENTMSLGGRVLDEYGKPVPGAEVRIESRHKTSRGITTSRIVSALERWDIRADAKGRFVTPRRLVRHDEHRALVFDARGGRGETVWFASSTPSFFDITLFRPTPTEWSPIATNIDAGWKAIWGADFAVAEARMSDAVAEANKKGIEDPLWRARWLAGLAEAQLGLGKAAETEPLARHVLELREKVLGPDHREIADAEYLLARISYAHGDYASAEEHSLKALAMRERVQGSDHPDFARDLSLVGAIETQRGRLAEAEAKLSRAVVIMEVTTGLDNPGLVIPLTNHAVALERLGRSLEAVVIYRRALDLANKVPGSAHPNRAFIIERLAPLLRLNGQDREADDLLRDKPVPKRP